MNRHIFLDRLSVRLASLAAGSNRYFSRSIESLPFNEILNHMDLRMPEIHGEGIFPVTAETTTGPLDAAFRVEKWLGDTYPTLIYHHGNNERPFDTRKSSKNTFLRIFVSSREAFPANLIVVRAPYHDCPLKDYQGKMTSLQNFMNMLAVSVRLNEEIIRTLGGKSPVYTCGISLGGWVTNLHRCHYNSSDWYIPLMAGTFLGELFLESDYRLLTGSPALDHPEKIRELLNFSNAFDQIGSKNAFPLLARHDRFAEFEVQGKSYKGFALRRLEAGHVTGAMNTAELRSHILQVMEITGNGGKGEREGEDE